MAYFASSDVDVALAQRDIVPLGMSKKMTFPVITFGNGALQYHATTKVPMPVIGKFGFKKAIERVFIEQPANGYIYHYDRTNNRVRILLGAARDAITVADHANIALPTPTGTVAATTATSAGTPAGNVVEAAHSHDLTILANNAGAGTSTDGVGVNAANQALVSETATGAVILGGNVANKGGVDNTTPANATFTGVALATHTHGAQAFTGDAPANLANLTHTVTGGGAVAEAPLAEMDNGVAPAAVTLYTQMIGQ